VLLLAQSVTFGGRYTDSMLRLGVSPRGSALGGAAGSLFETGAVFLQNPGNISYLNNSEFRALYISQFGLANYNYLGAAHPFGSDYVFAVNWLHLSVDDIPLRPDLSDLTLLTQRDSARTLLNNPLGAFTDREDAVFLSLAKMFRWDLDLGLRYFSFPVETPVGVNIKYLNRRIHTVRGSGLGIDVSIGAKFWLSKLLDVKWMGRLGNALLLQDLTGTPVSWNTKSQDVMHPSLRWSISYEQPITKMSGQLNAVYTRSTRYGTEPSWGIEYRFRDFLGLQVGTSQAQFNAGISFYPTIFTLPFAVEYSLGNHVLGYSHRLGLSVLLSKQI